jgi:DNA-binding protein HU-beta
LTEGNPVTGNFDPLTTNGQRAISRPSYDTRSVALEAAYLAGSSRQLRPVGAGTLWRCAAVGEEQGSGWENEMAAKKKKAAKKTAMNKADLVEMMFSSKPASFKTKAEAERALELMLSSIRKGLKKYKSVRLINFGTFEVRSRKRRRGINPQTKEQIWIPASKTVAFRVGKQLRDSVN